jgi:folylpolyglutamate synthase/dihydropteroate synthase
MKDKDIEKVAARLFPLANRIILTRPPLDRAARPEDIAQLIKEFSPRFFWKTKYLHPEAGSDFILGKSAVLVAGSLFLVGEAKKFFAGPDPGEKLACL